MPSGAEQAFADQVLHASTGRSLHDAAEQAVAEVRVLVGVSRVPGEQHAAGDRVVELVVGDVEVPVGPRVVGGHAGRHRQQVADADRRGIVVGRRARRRARARDERSDRRATARPRRAAISTAAAVKLLVIDAIRYTVCSVGAARRRRSTCRSSPRGPAVRRRRRPQAMRRAVVLGRVSTRPAARRSGSASCQAHSAPVIAANSSS